MMHLNLWPTVMLCCCFAVGACTGPADNPQQAKAETGLTTPQYFYLSDIQLETLKKSALSGNGSAALRIAQYYGGTREDFESALRWYGISAQEGNEEGMYDYGISLTEKGEHHDQAQARHWLLKAANSHDPNLSAAAKSELNVMSRE